MLFLLTELLDIFSVMNLRVLLRHRVSLPKPCNNLGNVLF